nr:acyltransferase family protein [uncultured Rhodoferax sp.]
MTNFSPSAPQFRNDINGLRAWAVVAVILYHFGISGFKGGFSGVDVFFVISGFLMTGIVINSLEKGNFSLFSFYTARARRIFPALVVLCVILLLLGWWMLTPMDYKTLATHVIFSLTFLSNFKFQHEAGYFDAESHEKWLLHTWSLATEWQFYILLPLILVALWKWHADRRYILVAIVIGLFSSLALSIITTPIWPTAAFFLLHSRAWELLAGGLIYLLEKRYSFTLFQRSALEFAGLALILGAILSLNVDSSWPGWLAVVPVAGSAVVLLANRPTSIWTNNLMAQWLGTRSYSLYLWHWPVVVALNFMDLSTDHKAIAVGLIITLLLGQLSYQFVEMPARIKLSKLSLSLGSATLLTIMLLVIFSAAIIRGKDGVPGRQSAEIETVASETLNRNPRQLECMLSIGHESPSCIHGNAPLRAILIGDSHANSIVSALAISSKIENNGSVMEWTYAACPTIFDVLPTEKSGQPKEYQCNIFLDWANSRLKSISNNIPIVIVNRTSVYSLGYNGKLEKNRNTPLVYFKNPNPAIPSDFLDTFSQHLTETACQLAKYHPVYMMRPLPEMPVHIPNVMSRAMILGKTKDIFITLDEYKKRHSIVLAAQDAARDRCGIKILDPIPYLCKNDRCHGDQNGRPIYYDGNHMSEYGNKLLVPMFSDIFKANKKFNFEITHD